MHRPIHPAADVSPSVHAEVAQNKEPDQVRVRSADGPEPHPDPDPRPRANTPGAIRPEPGPAYVASSYRYAPSPLPMRWDEGERRRPEYFGGEYRYYPTPVREGIYSIATDANRLTTIFSEENPNACSIAWEKRFVALGSHACIIDYFLLFLVFLAENLIPMNAKKMFVRASGRHCIENLWVQTTFTKEGE